VRTLLSTLTPYKKNAAGQLQVAAAKPSPTSAEILRNKMAFFSAVSQPVRINARVFLGLEPTVAIAAVAEVSPGKEEEEKKGGEEERERRSAESGMKTSGSGEKIQDEVLAECSRRKKDKKQPVVKVC